MTYVLLVVTFIYGGTTYNSTEFRSSAACSKARETVIMMANKIRPSGYLIAECVAKD